MINRVIILTPTLDRYGSARTLKAIVDAFPKNPNIKLEIWYPLDVERNAKIFPDNSKVEYRQVDFPILRRSNLYGPNAIKFLVQSCFNLRKLRKDLKSSKSQDFLHCFTAATILGGLLLPRRNRQLSLHEITEGRIERTALRVIAKVLFSRLIFASKYLKNFYKLSGQVIYSGGDIEKFLAVPEISIMENEAIQILCVGRFNHWKGQHVAIDAARILKESNCNFHLSFLGSGFYDDSYYQQCKDLASNFFLSERVTFLEERDDITGVLGRAHILIVPSIKPEPFGKVVVEGMAASRVVIATRVGGPAEIIEDGKSGALVDNANPTQLAETVRRFIEDTNLYDRVKREARSRSKDFSESTMTHSYLKSIEELTGLNFRGGE